jgi:hypothetical protein
MLSITFLKNNTHTDKTLLLCSIYIDNNKTIIFEEYIDINKITSITRLYVDYVFGGNKINNIAKKYETLLDNDEKSILDKIQDLIFTECVNDKCWKLCNTCNLEYTTKKRNFEEVCFIQNNQYTCKDHTI